MDLRRSRSLGGLVCVVLLLDVCKEKEEKGDKANEFVALKAPVFSSQTDLGIAG